MEEPKELQETEDGSEENSSDDAGPDEDFLCASNDTDSLSRLERERKLRRSKTRKSTWMRRQEDAPSQLDLPSSERICSDSPPVKIDSQESKEHKSPPTGANAARPAQVFSREGASQAKTNIQSAQAREISEDEREKLDMGVNELLNVIKEIPVLDFLRGRIAVSQQRGIDSQTLLGFYRISSRMLKEEYEKKREQLKKNEIDMEEYKRIAEDLKGNLFRQPGQWSPQREKVREIAGEKPKVEVNKDAIEQEQELFMLRETVKQKEKKLGEYIDLLEKQKTDFTNYRGRSAKEVAMQVDSNFEDLVSKFLPVIDNFDRAIGASKNTQDLGSIVQGIEMIRYQFEEVLKRVGVEPIRSKGEPFNPKIHEAISVVNTDDCPDETVVEEVNRGYIIKTKVLRPALVKVSRRITPECINTANTAGSPQSAAGPSEAAVTASPVEVSTQGNQAGPDVTMDSDKE